MCVFRDLFRGLGFRVQGFGVWGSGLQVYGLCVRWCLGAAGDPDKHLAQRPSPRIPFLTKRVKGLGWASSLTRFL